VSAEIASLQLLAAVLLLGVVGLLAVTIVGAFRPLLDPGEWVRGDSATGRRSRRRWVVRGIAASAGSSSIGLLISESWLDVLGVVLGVVAAILGVIATLELARPLGSKRLEASLRAGVMARIAVEPLFLVDLALGAVAYRVAAFTQPLVGDFSILRLSLACSGVNVLFTLAIGFVASWVLWPPEAASPWRNASQRAVKRSVSTS